MGSHSCNVGSPLSHASFSPIQCTIKGMVNTQKCCAQSSVHMNDKVVENTDERHVDAFGGMFYCDVGASLSYQGSTRVCPCSPHKYSQNKGE